jgi:hypothetical protein
MATKIELRSRPETMPYERRAAMRNTVIAGLMGVMMAVAAANVAGQVTGSTTIGVPAGDVSLEGLAQELLERWAIRGGELHLAGIECLGQLISPPSTFLPCGNDRSPGEAQSKVFVMRVPVSWGCRA